MFPLKADSVDIKAGLDLKDRFIPPKLYKFRSHCDSHLDALRRGVLFSSSPDRLNDPLEAYLYFDYDRILTEDISLSEQSAKIEALRTGRPSPDLSPRAYDMVESGARARAYIQQFVDEGEIHPLAAQILLKMMNEKGAEMEELLWDTLRAQIGIVSLTENLLSPLMWTHYSSGQTGFCIEYNFQDLPSEDVLRATCYPVVYSAKPRDVTGYFSAPHKKRNTFIAPYLAMIKSTDWAYEKEWRIITLLGRQRANGPISMPRPSAIYLGPAAKSETAAELRSICESQKIPLRHLIRQRRSFALSVAT